MRRPAATGSRPSAAGSTPSRPAAAAPTRSRRRAGRRPTSSISWAYPRPVTGNRVVARSAPADDGQLGGLVEPLGQLDAALRTGDDRAVVARGDLGPGDAGHRAGAICQGRAAADVDAAVGQRPGRRDAGRLAQDQVRERQGVDADVEQRAGAQGRVPQAGPRRVAPRSPARHGPAGPRRRRRRRRAVGPGGCWGWCASTSPRRRTAPVRGPRRRGRRCRRRSWSAPSRTGRACRPRSTDGRPRGGARGVSRRR